MFILSGVRFVPLKVEISLNYTVTKKTTENRPFNEGRAIARVRANTRPKTIDEAVPERLIARPGGRLLGCARCFYFRIIS